MNIVVFVKQVPDTKDIKWTQNNNIDRANMDCIINPMDKEALEAALNIKEEIESEITAITMGPKNAENILKEAIAMGIDEGVILSDAKFAGSDTNATSKVLSSVIKEKYKEVDLIMFGQSAIDGETSQSGISTATRLELPYVTNVNKIYEYNEKEIVVQQETEKEKITYKVELPAVICIKDYIRKPRLAKIGGYIRAKGYEIKKYNINDIKLKEEETGIKGSPTQVSKVYRNEKTRNCEIIDSQENKDYAEIIVKEIKKIMEN